MNISDWLFIIMCLLDLLLFLGLATCFIKLCHDFNKEPPKVIIILNDWLMKSAIYRGDVPNRRY